MTAATAAERKLLVCVGVSYVVQGSKKRHNMWREAIDGVAAEGDTLVWTAIKGTVGSVYSIEFAEWTAETHTIKPSTLRYESVWEDREDVLRWQVEAKALDTAHEAQAMEARAAKDGDELVRALAPIRRLYSRALPNARAAILARIVMELNRR